MIKILLLYFISIVSILANSYRDMANATLNSVVEQKELAKIDRYTISDSTKLTKIDFISKKYTKFLIKQELKLTKKQH